MKFGGGEVAIAAGTGVVGTAFSPVVRVRVADEAGGEVTIHVTPAQARRLGLDLVSAAVGALHDVAMREVARQRGVDGDGLIEDVKTHVESIFDG